MGLLPGAPDPIMRGKRRGSVAARERIRDLERAAQEGDLAMGSVRKKLEQHLARARAEVKRLTEG